MDAPWAGYVRVSSVGGRKGEKFHSPDDQAAVIKAWAAARRQPLTLLTPELDESGGRVDRPILTAAIEGIERGEYRGLVVAYLSRASRSTRHLLEMWDRVERVGGEVIAVAENIDTSTPAGRLTRTMLAAIAEHELDLHRERFAALRESATRRGIWQRRQTPTGYRRHPKTRCLEPDDKAPLVQWAYRERVEGLPLTEIADRLAMTPSGARHLLTNRVYLGELRSGENVNPSAHPALVEEDLWLAAQAKHVARTVRRGEPALLAGLVRCCGCGHVMSRSRSGAAVVYACAVRHSLGHCEQAAAITARLLDDHVEQIALQHLARLQARTSGDGTALERARGLLRTAEVELSAFLEAIDAAGLRKSEAVAAIRGRRERVEAAREEVGVLLAQRSAVPQGDVLALWPDLPFRDRNNVLRGLIECVLVARVGRGRSVPVDQRARMIAHGAGIVPLRFEGGGIKLAITPIDLPDADHPAVLGMPSA